MQRSIHFRDGRFSENWSPNPVKGAADEENREPQQGDVLKVREERAKYELSKGMAVMQFIEYSNEMATKAADPDVRDENLSIVYKNMD